MIRLPRLYGVADRTFGDPGRQAEALFRGGVELVQLRDKTSSSRLLLECARHIVGMARPGVRIIINDRVDVALLSGAHGVHVGQNDMAVEDVRRIAPGLIVGLSTHTPEQVAVAETLDVDYVAVGPVFPTSTKNDASPVIGCRGVVAARERTCRPIVAIGGIALANVESVIASGADSVAVVSGLVGQADPAGAAIEFRMKLNRIGAV